MGTYNRGSLINLASFTYAETVLSQQFYIAENMVNHRKMVHPPCIL